MTNQWQGPKGAAYNAVFGFCRGFGWTSGFDREGRVVHTREGAKVVRAYQLENKA